MFVAFHVQHPYDEYFSQIVCVSLILVKSLLDGGLKWVNFVIITVEKTRTKALFWLSTSYHTQRYIFQCYMLHSLLTQSFNIVNTPVILLFSKKWVPGFAAEDNNTI